MSKLKVTNWRNFTNAEVNLAETTWLIGPNASGKSNLLDVFRFFRDLVKAQGGGLQSAIETRGGLSKVRSLAARNKPQVELEVELRESLDDLSGEADWKYRLSIKREAGGKHRPLVEKEEVTKKGKLILERPGKADKEDKERLTQTHLEQINMNEEFRSISEFFEQVLYLHLVPQLLKFGNRLSVAQESDPFGQMFLEEIAKTPSRTRDSRLKKIEKVLKQIVANFENLRFQRDETSGKPHLEMRYKHWRPKAGWQREDQFSDGTLRMIALTWTLLTTNKMILLEEPELSLHKRVVEQIPDLIQKTRQLRRKSGGQILISTHSEVILSSHSIDGNFLILKPSAAGETTGISEPTADDIESL
ncbi:AAA family ATPase, partial [Myxococcota bacterium]|nr:AAA family ATPase [Myxococcota bacterium]